jgi:hypothetical protein
MIREKMEGMLLFIQIKSIEPSEKKLIAGSLDCELMKNK